MSTNAKSSICDRAEQLTAAGISVIPIKNDGSKAAAVSWKPCQSEIADPATLSQWFGNGADCGIGAVGGKVSGNLEVMDFDDPESYERWTKLVGRVAPELLERLVIVRTPTGGYHVFYRCRDGVERNQYLARRKVKGKTKVLIETRGEGGYVLLPGSPPSCHHANKRYELIQGDFTKIPTIDAAERDSLLQCARALNEYVKPARVFATSTNGDGHRPGDEFNRKATWEETLEPHGWVKVGHNGETAHWRRPDKGTDVSATTNYDCSDLFYVFSTNADPFEAQRAYDKFAAYTYLNHDKDFSAAAADLAEQGYGSEPAPFSLTSLISQPNLAGWPPPLGEDAFQGLVGDFVRTIEPHTEADPAALLIQFHVAFGNVIDRKAHYLVEADKHYMNLNALLVGETAKGRKGTSWGHIRRVFEEIDYEWAEKRIQDGLSSGEGLIWAVRDTSDNEYGIEDSRLLIVQGEFAGALKVLRREGNTLSAVIRNAWDTGNLNTLVKHDAAKATGAHISIIGHITRQELLRYLDETETANGFGNRFLFVCVSRSKSLQEGGNLSDEELKPLIVRLKVAVDFARRAKRFSFDEQARKLWHQVYPQLSEGKPGMLGSMTARGEAQVVRLASVYALLDESTTICEPHLKAALEVWRYCDDSCRYIFGVSLGDPPADKLILELRQAPDGLSRTEIHQLFNRHQTATQIDRALAQLEQTGRARKESKKTGGRPAETWFAVQGAKKAKKAKKAA